MLSGGRVPAPRSSGIRGANPRVDEEVGMVQSSSSGGRYQIDAQKLWIGGLMAGIVAAGVAIVGLLIVRGVFDIKVFVTGDSGEIVNASTWWYAVVSFFFALFATGLLHLLLISAPSPWRFFGWIVGLAVAIAVIIPFTSDAELAAQVGTAAINLAVGIAVFSIVSGVGHSAAQARRF
jgi:Family of unknown function (DUF6069)